MAAKPKRVLAISSGGGHWVQLLRLRPAFGGCVVTFACVRPAYAGDVAGQQYVSFTDATRWDRWRLLKMFVEVAILVIGSRPDVIITTGAAPGYVAIRVGRLLGAKTIWLDSIANVESLSLSGAKVGAYADLWLTQWQHLARSGGPRFEGAVI